MRPGRVVLKLIWPNIAFTQLAPGTEEAVTSVRRPHVALQKRVVLNEFHKNFLF